MTGSRQERYEGAHRLDLVQEPPGAFARITRVAARSRAGAVAALSLTDATCQWLVAPSGPQLHLPPMTPLAASPCHAAALGRQPLVIPDLAIHEEFGAGLLAATGVRFYAAAPLLLADGSALGVICLMDGRPGDDGPSVVPLLQDLAALAIDAIALHRDCRIDPLTGLPNLADLLDELAAVPPGQPRQLALIDLAHPTEIAHMLHAVGSARLDEMILWGSLGLRATIDPAARLFHVGHAQFAALAPPGTSAEDLAQRLSEDLSHRELGRDALFSITRTAGLVTVQPGHQPPAGALQHARIALDTARAEHLPVSIYAPEQDAAFRRTATLLHDFSDALTDGVSLRLVFQPRLELASGNCVGIEALLRWAHPTLGEVPPGEFVRLIERTILARNLMHWVLEHALRQLGAWRAVGIHLRVSVNVSPANLEDADFSSHVLRALSEAGLAPTALELEITESALLDDGGPALQQLRTLSDAGVCIAIDDFGTGYSSLSYLQRLPADVVKIDQSFVRGLSQTGTDEGRRRTLVTAMIGLSHDLGYRVVAEGIEDQDAADVLLALGCDEVQGYWFARPMPADTFTSWYAQRPWTRTRAALRPAPLARTRPELPRPAMPGSAAPLRCV